MIPWTEEDLMLLRSMHIRVPPRTEIDPGIYLLIGAVASVVLVGGLFGLLRNL